MSNVIDLPLSTKEELKFQKAELAAMVDELEREVPEALAEAVGRSQAFHQTFSLPKELSDKEVQKMAVWIYEKKHGKPQASKKFDGLYTIESLLDPLYKLYEEGSKPGLKTGWPELDVLYSVRPGEMTIVTGIPGHGKSNFMDSLMVNLWRNHKWRFAVCSPENWPIQRHIAGILEKVVGKPFFRSGIYEERMTRNDIGPALADIQDYFFFMALDDQQMSVPAILKIAEKAIKEHEVNGIIIDPWNELDHKRPPNVTEHEYISKTLTLIRRFARKHQVHLWVVAHPRKQQKENGSYTVPTMYEISGSGTWYDKADNGICVFRHFDSAKVDICIQKIRFRDVGRPGVATLAFVQDTATYISLEGKAY